MRLGLVTNAPVYDASPAAFVCHVPSRRDYAAIIDRYLELEPYVLMGGGKEQFLPKSQPGSRRTDETDMIAAFEKKGYRLADTKEELERPTSGKLLGLFAPRDMSFELDRDKDREPSVYDMTRATIRLLHDQNPRGFFAFIESENIDSAAHISDIASVIHDYREFDRAVGLAYDFYRKYPHDTLIIVTSDHETGGLGFTLALKDLTSTKVSNQVAATTADLKKLQLLDISLQKAAQILGPSSQFRRGRQAYARALRWIRFGARIQGGDHQTSAGFPHHVFRLDRQHPRLDGGKQHASLLANRHAHEPAGARRGARCGRRTLSWLLR